MTSLHNNIQPATSDFFTYPEGHFCVLFTGNGRPQIHCFHTESEETAFLWGMQGVTPRYSLDEKSSKANQEALDLFSSLNAIDNLRVFQRPTLVHSFSVSSPDTIDAIFKPFSPWDKINPSDGKSTQVCVESYCRGQLAITTNPFSFNAARTVKLNAQPTALCLHIIHDHDQVRIAISSKCWDFYLTPIESELSSQLIDMLGLAI
jgi:hypothetical protein